MNKHTHKKNPLSSMLLAIAATVGTPIVGLSTLTICTSQTIAQNTSSDDASTKRDKRNALLDLSKPITLDVSDQPISDIFQFIIDVTGVDLEPIFLTDNASGVGIDPDTLITLKVTNTPALNVLERILNKAQRLEATGEEYTWQFSDIGTIECGPKSELNRNTRVELYDVADLLFVVPDFDNAPEFDLQSAISSTQGGSPFSGGGNDALDEVPTAERVEAISDLLQAAVEPDQWIALGGDSSITYYGTSFVITAPDYIHRQIGGYAFWPARLQQIRRVDGRQQIKIQPETKKRRKP